MLKGITATSALLLLIFLSGCNLENKTSEKEETAPDYVNWSTYLGDTHSTQYSLLDQITKENVQQLEVAWTYKPGDSEGREIQCNPIIIDSMLYGTTGMFKCFALDAATGEEIWVFNPFANVKTGGGNNRGLAYW
jgi:quinoprotein glucose dehydrogenase